ncbi:hypothetical protein NHX12_003381 [Muraenolepis orangiensis]|uniref:Uncharacterized protein n=1 Tax=Muraenolepis orangiensis TaxID=630683 RepID=A0A9Q0IH58_9TELE|nr:hypothetical protein NHX12_003381 [Muraenolepis orangiensis]
MVVEVAGVEVGMVVEVAGVEVVEVAGVEVVEVGEVAGVEVVGGGPGVRRRELRSYQALVRQMVNSNEGERRDQEGGKEF